MLAPGVLLSGQLLSVSSLPVADEVVNAVLAIFFDVSQDMLDRNGLLAEDWYQD